MCSAQSLQRLGSTLMSFRSSGLKSFLVLRFSLPSLSLILRRNTLPQAEGQPMLPKLLFTKDASVRQHPCLNDKYFKQQLQEKILKF